MEQEKEYLQKTYKDVEAKDVIKENLLAMMRAKLLKSDENNK
jgi:hypothetical protein